MSLFGYSGKLLVNNSGSFAASKSCCCDQEPDSDDPPLPPPTGPFCDCSLFSQCTLTVTYLDMPPMVLPASGAVLSNNKTYGSGYVRWLAFGSTQDAFIFFDAFVEADTRSTGCSATSLREAIAGCESPSSNVQYHASVNYFNAIPATRNWLSYYRYNIVGLDLSDPCPNSANGLQVTVSEIARVQAGLRSLAGICGVSCRQFVAEILNILNATYFEFFNGFNISRVFVPATWGDPPGLQTVTLGDSLENICQFAGNEDARPSLTVTCPP
jgi:hypothetical protein